MGVMIVAPFLLVLLSNLSDENWWQQKNLWQSLQGAALALFCGVLIFGGWLEIRGLLSVLLLAPLPVIIWCAYRFGPIGVTTAVLFFSSVALIGTSQGKGPFFSQDMHFSFVLFFAYISVHSLIGLLMASALSERKRQNATIDTLKNKLDHLSRSVPDVTLILDEKDKCLHAYSAGSLEIKNFKNQMVAEFLRPESNQVAYRALEYAKSSRTVQVVDAHLMLQEEERAFNLRISPIVGEDRQSRLALLFRKIKSP